MVGLENWQFLIGKWEGKVIKQLEDEGDIISKIEFNKEKEENFIVGKQRSINEKGFVNSSLIILLYDKEKEMFLRKSIFAHGFVNNEIEIKGENINRIEFHVAVEPYPDNFKGIYWRSFIEKLSENKIQMGLKMRRDNDDKFTDFIISEYIKVTNN